jgi:hypothetical protein
MSGVQVRFLGSMLLLLLTTSAVSAHTQTQLCWVVGRFDNTIYYAEAEGREDRSASFSELLNISGIEIAACNDRLAIISISREDC